MVNKPQKKSLEFFSKYILLIPLLLLIAIMIVYPLIRNIYMSFFDVKWGKIQEFCGIKNYLNVLIDQGFWESMLFSLKFSITVTLLEIFFGLLLAVYFDKFLSRNQWIIAFFLLPMLVPPVLTGIMFKLMLNSFVGIVPQYLQLFGVNLNFLSVKGVIPTLIFADFIQWTPFTFLIIYSALQTIPISLYEAAKIDGANSPQIFNNIVLPLLLPSIGISSFLRFIEVFRTFDVIYALTGGGPGNKTTTISIYIYKAAFERGNFSQAVVSSIFLLIFALIPLYISMKFILRGSEYE